MHDFVLREIKDADIQKELLNIGFDKSYIHKAAQKFDYKNIKIYSLTSAQANIIKQTAISVGADCATHREVITGKVELSNCILGGSVSEIKKIAEKLKSQPFGLKELGEKLIKFFDKKQKLNCAKIVGILNLTVNSFSDGGLYNDFESAQKHLLEMINDGADIIDIGAESTKPYSFPVSDEEQLKKLLPIVEYAKGRISLSVDTRSAKVAEACLKAGANMINDVSGFDYDAEMINIIGKYNCPVVIQHSKGSPENMQNSPEYSDVIEEIFVELDKKCKLAKLNGIENIIIDPGIGFGKTRENNFEIIRRIEEFKSLGCPIMLGLSRKSFLGLEENIERDIFTTVFDALAIERNVDYLRVHNVKMHKTLIDLMKMFMV